MPREGASAGGARGAGRDQVGEARFGQLVARGHFLEREVERLDGLAQLRQIVAGGRRLGLDSDSDAAGL